MKQIYVIFLSVILFSVVYFGATTKSHYNLAGLYKTPSGGFVTLNILFDNENACLKVRTALIDFAALHPEDAFGTVQQIICIDVSTGDWT